ncbi:putative short-chain dehydrogenase [Hypoxylon sp. FL1284]|nr:putative short-chain dehydrogenase [Hypoxylon sp. FL1284]
MTCTTHPEFNEATEALEVAKAFPDSVKGKTILVTGVNLRGLGFSAAQGFASQSPAHLILAGRTPAKIQESIDALKKDYPDVDYRGLSLDLSKQKAVRAAAAELLSWADVPAVDILVNSAGIMNIPERTIGEDGIEITFATNHVGHFLFTCLIMPKLIAAAERNPKGATRVVNVSSGSPTVAQMRWSDPNFERASRDLPEEERPNYVFTEAWGFKDPANMSYIPIEAYNQSKVANVLFGIGLTRRLYEKHGILSVGLHPGVIATELGRVTQPETLEAIKKITEEGLFKYKSFGAGGATTVVAALDPKLGAPETKDGKENHGAYFWDCQICDNAVPKAVSSSEAEKLWARSEELVNEKFSW